MAAAFSGAFEVTMTDETQAPEEQETISDLFVDESETEVETESNTESETEETDESKGEETESETKSEDEETQTKTETPSEEEEESPSVPRQALIAERQKRQQIEQELKMLRQKHDITDDDEPDPVDDPEGWKQFQFSKWKQEQWQETADKSRAVMLEKKTDYEEKELFFVSMAQRNPELAQQMQAHHDPAAFAYEKASEEMEKLDKAAEERVLARLKKEGKLKEEKPDTGKSKASEVSDLIKSTGAGKNSETKEELPEDPGDFF